MKKFVCFLMLGFMSSLVLIAQTPQSFKYQAVARDDAGNVLSICNIGLRISIMQKGADVNAVYVETHRVQTNIYGLINLVAGEGEAVIGDFSSIKWGENRHFLKIEMDIDGGSEYKEIGTSQLYAVPYALYAAQAGSLAEPEKKEVSATHDNPPQKTKSNGGNRNGTPNSKLPAADNSYLNVNVGKVGIGTTGPGEKLEVVGKIMSHGLIISDANGHPWEIILDTTGSLVIFSAFRQCGDSLYDFRDGQYYQTVLIETQCWFAENINIGSIITPAEGEQQDNGTIEKYCYSNIPANCDTFGGLYQWNEAMQYVPTPGARGICPEGWHLPKLQDRTDLANSLGGAGIAGGKMKTTGTIEAGTGFWRDPNTDATNESGFSGLPGGIRDYDSGIFNYTGYYGYNWLSDAAGSSNAFFLGLDYYYPDLGISAYPKTYGLAVRCLMN